MTTTASSNKLHSGRNLFFFTLRKNGAIVLLASILSLLACPGFILSDYQRYANRNLFHFYSLGDALTGIVLITSILSSGLLVILCCINFDFLYHKKSSDVFHALPLSRFKLFFSRFLASALGSMLPATLSYLSLAILLALPDFDGITYLKILQIYLLTLLFILLCTAFMSLVAVCTGRIFDMIIAALVINIGLPLLYLIGLTLCEQYLIGFSINNAMRLCFDLSPFAAFCYHTAVLGSQAFDWNAVLYSFLFLCCFLVMAVTLYRTRRSEKAEEPFAFAFVPRILQFLTALLAGFLVGVLFYNGDNKNPLFWVFAVAGCLLGAAILGGIMERGFKRYRRSLLIGLGSAAALFALFFIIVTGAFGFEKRLPKESQIEAATAQVNGLTIDFQDPQQVLEFHKAIVANIEQPNEIETNSGYYNYFRITYQMKNGSRIVREYDATYVSNEAIVKLVQSQDYLDALTNDILGDTLSSFSITGLGREDVTLSASEAEELMRQYRIDIAGMTAEVLNTEWEDGYLSIYSMREGYQNGGELIVLSSFTNTRKYLDEIGFFTRGNPFPTALD